MALAEIAELIKGNPSDFTRGKERFISEDLIKYLKEHNMIPNDQADKIINVVDINDVESADYILKGHIYGFGARKNSQLYEARYFAPHFCGDASAHPGLPKGVSYIAKILTIEFAETGAEFTKK